MDDDGFISLPPGMIDPDSGTLRRPQPERTVRVKEDIVFVPSGPGVPPVVFPEDPVEVGGQETAPTDDVAATDSDDAEETRLSTPRHGKPTWRLAIPGIDSTVVVDKALFLGRNPSATPDYPDAPALSVPDPAKSISKTHALLELDAGELWVHDLDSTNGVWVVPPGGEPIEVVPGVRVAIPPGADLELGDVVIQVEHS